MENCQIESIENEVKIRGNKNKRFNLKYLIEEDNTETFLFGKSFVEANYDKCYLIINNIDTELTYKYIFPKKGEHIITLVIKDDNNLVFKGMFDIKIRNAEKKNLDLFRSSIERYRNLIQNASDSLFNNKSNKINYFIEFVSNKLIDISSLENLDVSNAKDLSYMFCGCSKVKNFDFLKKWDVAKCENFEGLFAGCSFFDINFLSSWNLIQATNLKGMFCGCRQLKNINGCKNWNVGKVQNFSGIFDCCLSLIDANALQNWNMSNATTIKCLFSDCVNLENMNSLFKWKLNNKVDKFNLTLRCVKLKNIPSNLKEKEEGVGCHVF